jgi:hypothetical protein
MRGELEPSMYAGLDLLAWLVVMIILTFRHINFVDIATRQECE